MSDESSFFGGLDILDGMPSRQAGTILFAIEGRTAQLVSIWYPIDRWAPLLYLIPGVAGKSIPTEPLSLM
jgi:hypothetical protein